MKITPVVIAVLFFLSSIASAAIYTVSTCVDSGAGTLRQAITDANGSPGADTIVFSIPTSEAIWVTGVPGVKWYRIRPSSAALPNITEQVIIDGTTQPTFDAYNNPYGPEIEIDNLAAGTFFGLNIIADDCVIKGLSIHSFFTAGIAMAGSRNRVYGCYIGTDITGEAARANSNGIYLSLGASYNIIGSIESGNRNLISGNTNSGILTSYGCSSNEALGNYIGTGRSGATALGNATGISLGADNSVSRYNKIGNGTTNGKNVISGNTNGITLRAASYNEILGNYIGTDWNGTSALGNTGWGILIQPGFSGGGATIESEYNKIGSETAPLANYIVANGVGIRVSGATSNEVYQNIIGINASDADLGNTGNGVEILAGAKYNKIGKSGGRNIISGNDVNGVYISGGGTNNNEVAGNYIGTKALGTEALGNTVNGVEIIGEASFNKIGDETAEGRNAISGNGVYGVCIRGVGTNGNEICGNYIGLDKDGAAALGNSNSGVCLIEGTKLNKIGTVLGVRNVISGNGGQGIYIYGTGTDSNEVLGNFIGMDAGGAIDRGNSTSGIGIYAGGKFNKIGSLTRGNYVSGNDAEGIVISASNSNEVIGNYIGTESTGASALANASGGVYIQSGAQFNRVGTLNTIAFNGGAGVRVDGPATLYNKINQNRIFENVGLGIELTGSGNGGINSPGIISAVYNTYGTTEVTGEAVANAAVEVFATGAPDPSGSGEGRSYRSSANSSGAGSWSASLTGLTVGTTLTATATDTNNNTSGFSYNIIVLSATAEYYVSPSGNNGNNGQSWGTAWRNVSYAATQAASGATVHVAAGTYNVAAGEIFPIYVNSGVHMIATTPRAATMEVATNDDTINLSANCTLQAFSIVSSAIGANGVDLLGSGCMVINNQIICTGFGGYGVHLVDPADGCVIWNNSIFAGNSGFGVRAETNVDGLVIEANVIEAADHGIILYQNNNNYNIYYNLIAGSGAVGSNGMMIGYGGNSVQSGRIKWNDVRGFGNTGISINTSGTATVENNTVVKNVWYGVATNGTGTVILKNSAVSKDPDGGTSSGYGVYRTAGTTNVSYCDVYGNQYNYTNVTPVGGTIDAIARFVSVPGNDYHLLNNSPCIDSGDPASLKDPDGTRADMGCYPYNQITSATPCVYVKAPNGGETMTGLTTYEITWYATHDGYSIDHIELYRSLDGGATYPYTISSNTPNDGSFVWNVTNTPTSQAKIRMIAVGSAGTDESDANFTIYSTDLTGPTIEALTPTNGTQIKGGTPYNITWTITDESGIKPNSLSIYYSTDNGATYPFTILSNSTEADNAYTWNVTALDTSEAKIKITAKDTAPAENAGTAESAGKFIVDSTGPSAPNLTSPADGTITNAANQTFTWQAAVDALTGVSSYEIRIDTVPATQGAVTSYNTTLSQGVHTWEVRARDGVGNWGNFSSSRTLTIDLVSPEVGYIVLRDRTTGSATETDEFTVTVEASGVSAEAAQMMIAQDAAFTQNSTGWIAYGASTQYTFTPLEGTREAYFKVRDAASNQSNVVTDSIVVKTSVPSCTAVALKDKVTGSTSYANSRSVSVEAANVTGSPVAMRLAQDAAFTQNDTGWLAFANPTRYTMTAGEGTKTVYYKLKDALDVEGLVFSGSIVFDASPPNVSIVSPIGGEIWISGITREVKWSASDDISGMANKPIDIYYSTNGGGAYPNILTLEAQNTGSCTWRVSPINSNWVRMKIFARDNAGNIGSDISDDDFRITSASPVVKVLTPAAGYAIKGGTAYNVLYSISGEVEITGVAIRFSSDNGANWTALATGYNNLQSYSFSVPMIDSMTCIISVDADDAAQKTGNAVSGTFVIDSTPPAVVSATPTSGASTVPVDSNIYIVFNEPMDRRSVEGAFSISSGVTGAFFWSVDSKTLTFKPKALYGKSDYQVSVGSAAQDMAGNYLSVPYSMSFATARPNETVPPSISIKVNDIPAKKGDYIPKQPKIKGRISDNFQMDPTTVRMLLDGNPVNYTTLSSSILTVEVEYNVTSDLAGEDAGAHTVMIDAADMAGNPATKEITELKVSYQQGKIAGPVLAYPTAFKPGKGQAAFLAYNLTADTDVLIYMFNISGQVEWAGKFTAGQVGGMAGYNAVEFKGVSDVTGAPLGNGMYVFKLVSGGKIIGTGYIVIND